MYEHFLDFIKKQGLVVAKDRVLLAVSGGLDSMAMLHLFSQSDIPFAVAHGNFGLRGAESDGDEAFVKDCAKTLGVPFFLRKFETKCYAKAQKCSIQMAARELRYAWFEELCLHENYQKVATAHHLNDSLETVLLNLAKGTSISGMRGILPVRGRIIRPMLDFSRAELEQMMKAAGLAWREDSSNKDTYYQRNLIRARVVAPLMSINPDLLGTFRDTIARNREVEQVFQAAMERLRATAVREEEEHVLISKAQLTGAYVLEQLLKPYAFGYGQAKEVWKAIHGHSGALFSSGTHDLVIDRHHLVITPATAHEQTEVLINKCDTEVTISGKAYDLMIIDSGEMPEDWKNSNHAFLDLDKLRFPLRLRAWQEGDYFYPLGMKGKKKLSDFMIDRKIPVNLKPGLRVLESAGEIAWVVSLRVDDRFKITADTRRIFCLIENKCHV